MTDLTAYRCTIHIFDPIDGRVIEEHVLPVNSPDAEHATASTIANAASFTTKLNGTEVRPVAFACVRVDQR